jgi:hypothetical protein
VIRSGVFANERATSSQGSLLQKAVDDVRSASQHDTTVSVTEGDQFGTQCEAGLRQQAERQLNTALIVDMEFCWFSEHGESVALSVSEDAEGLGRQSWLVVTGRRSCSGWPHRRGNTFVAEG